MKILTLNANLKQIGTYGRCFYFSRELARHGHDVTMVTVSRDAKYQPRIYYKREYTSEYPEPVGEGPWMRMVEGPNFGYKWLPGWGAGPLDIGGRVKQILTDHYDVVYGFEYQPNVSWPIYLTYRLQSYRFYSDWCDWFAGGANRLRGYEWAHRIDAFLEEQIRFLAEKVTVTSRVLKDRALDIGISEEKVVWIPQGIDTDYCRPYPKAETRESLGLSLDRPIILAVREKSMEREIRVFDCVLDRMPETLFVVVGGIPKRAKTLAQKLDISDSIRWTGWVSDEDYPRYIACADVCFLPLDKNFINDQANWTGKFLDYLACGRPAVTNNVGEEGALLQEHQVGALAGSGDQEMAETIVSLLRDKERRRLLGENARRLMVEEWDWRVRGQQIAQVVEG
jgi:glycosyltransferase involved in cell wall biosynthesis